MFNNLEIVSKTGGWVGWVGGGRFPRDFFSWRRKIYLTWISLISGGPQHIIDIVDVNFPGFLLRLFLLGISVQCKKKINSVFPENFIFDFLVYLYLIFSQVTNVLAHWGKYFRRQFSFVQLVLGQVLPTCMRFCLETSFNWYNYQPFPTEIGNYLNFIQFKC